MKFTRDACTGMTLVKTLPVPGYRNMKKCWLAPLAHAENPRLPEIATPGQLVAERLASLADAAPEAAHADMKQASALSRGFAVQCCKTGEAVCQSGPKLVANPVKSSGMDPETLKNCTFTLHTETFRLYDIRDSG